MVSMSKGEGFKFKKLKRGVITFSYLTTFLSCNSQFFLTIENDF